MYQEHAREMRRLQALERHQEHQPRAAYKPPTRTQKVQTEPPEDYIKPIRRTVPTADFYAVTTAIVAAVTHRIPPSQSALQYIRLRQEMELFNVGKHPIQLRQKPIPRKGSTVDEDVLAVIPQTGTIRHCEIWMSQLGRWSKSQVQSALYRLIRQKKIARSLVKQNIYDYWRV
jgi:hypothetical protein